MGFKQSLLTLTLSRAKVNSPGRGNDINFPKRTCSPIDLFTSSLKEKAAFTLAEVLITLGIIGFVAAMVIPTFVRKYQYQVYATKLAEDYSILSNAIRIAENEYGPQELWEAPDGRNYIEFFEKYFKPHLKLLDAPCANNNRGSCRFQTYDMAGGTRMNGVGTLGTEAWDFIKVYLANGAMVGMRPASNQAAYFVFIDVNGEKGPNRQGIDTFMLVLSFNKEGTLKNYVGKFNFWYGLPSASDKTLKQYCSKDSVYAGLTCGALLQRNGFKIPKNEGWPDGYSYPY